VPIKKKKKRGLEFQQEGIMSKSEQNGSKKMPQLEESVSTEIQRIAKEEVREYRGLCSVCKNASTCTYRKDPRQPIWECDEFECESIQVSVFQPIDSPFKSDTEHKSSRKYAGLCVNCEKRETCTYRKPEGGVWHCEEYE
jgi:hypothetical protein